MPIPNLLVAPSLLPSQVEGGTASPDYRAWPELTVAAQRALEQLAAQRSALLAAQVPRMEQLWSGAGSERARETFEETLGLLTSRPWLSEDGGEPLVETLSTGRRSSSDGNDMTEYVRLNAIKRAADEGVRKLAHARARLSAVARRLEPRMTSIGADSEVSVAERRALESAARLAGAAAAASRHPLLAEDGGIDRRFTAALRQLPG
jgi:hypothetical protein